MQACIEDAVHTALGEWAANLRNDTASEGAPSATVQQVCEHLSSVLGQLEQRSMFLQAHSDDQSDMSDALEAHVFDELQSQIPGAKAAVEKEFRRLLGAA